MPGNKTKKVTEKTNINVMELDAQGVYYRQLNQTIRDSVKNGQKEFHLKNVNGQRYIGDGLVGSDVKITVEGVPGNDLGAFMDGPTIVVNGNAQDGIANTMNEGKIIIYGDCGDVLGYGMRGGKLFVQGDVGYRVGIHMKEYKNKIPVIIAGGVAGDFFGEYMAGGILLLLGNKKPASPAHQGAEENISMVGDYLGTGMHGGVIYLKHSEDIKNDRLGKEVAILELNEKDEKTLDTLLTEYCGDFGLNYEQVRQQRFIKLLPVSHRPYGKLYAY